jgi:hypothetical protein
MGWTRTKEGMDRARHEAGHATAAILLGLPVEEARIDAPEPGLAGFVRTPKGFIRTLYRAEKMLAFVVAGSLAEGPPLDWPFTERDEGDRGAAYTLCKLLKLDGAGFLRVESLARQLLRTQIGRRLQYELSGALLEYGRLSGEQVYELAERAGLSVTSNPVLVGVQRSAAAAGSKGGAADLLSVHPLAG